MAVFSARVDGTALPSEVTSLKRSDELLWSEGTGRSATTGVMSGSVVAKKQTYSLEWAMLTASQYNALRNAIGNDYMNLVIEINNATFASLNVYRGTVSGEFAGVFGGTAYYRNVLAEFVER